MSYTTLIDYSRQLMGQNGVLGNFVLASNSATSITGWKTKLYMSASTSVWSPYLEYNTRTKSAAFTFPSQAQFPVDYYTNNLSFNLNSGEIDGYPCGDLYFGASNTGIYHDTLNWASLQGTASYLPNVKAALMVVGSATTSASKAFTVSTYKYGHNGAGNTTAPTVGFSVDNALTVRIGENASSATSKVYFSQYVLGNVETHKTLMIGADGEVGVNSSNRELKQNIDYGYDSSWIYDLKPVQFEFKKYPGKIEYGFIAEDVEETNRDLATYESDGRLSGVKYESVAPIILKELIELRKKVDPSFKTTYEEDKVKVISGDYNIIHDGTIIARGGGDIKITISEKLSGVVRIKSLANVTVSSTRLIDEKWSQMELEDGSSVSLLCHDNFVYILSSDGDKLK